MVKRIDHQVIESVECKWCGHCKQFKPLERFGASKQTWDSLRPTCKDCLHQHNMETKAERTEYNKKYWEATKDAQKEKSKVWRENNKERAKAYMKKWLEDNKEHKKQKDAEYRIKNWDKRKAQTAAWKKQDYQNLKTDESRKLEFANHKIKHNTSRRIREILGQNKSDSCMQYVGCDLDKLRILLESQFKDGMTWNNYGENAEGGKTRAWHIDHKLPCNCFDLTNEVHRRACFHYTNLQPLWWHENIQKKDSFDLEERDRYIRWFTEVILL
jgi:hypothetical protein